MKSVLASWRALLVALCLVAMLFGGTSLAEDTVTYLYNSLDEETGEIVGESSRTIRRFSPSTVEVQIAWASFRDSTSGTQRYVVDNDVNGDSNEWPGESRR